MTHVLAAALVLQLHNLAGAPPAVVATAASELTRVYDEFGVHVEWDPAAAARVSGREIVRVVLLADQTGDLRHTPAIVLGAAVHTPSDSGVVYVFYRRIRAEAERHSVSTALVLACAMAHELGHLLMPGGGHSSDGLMRASWTGDDFHRADQGLLRFSPRQIALMRMAADLQPPVERERGDRARQ
jgi:hypothetical protein